MEEFQKILTGRGMFNDESYLWPTGGPPPVDNPLFNAADSKKLKALKGGFVEIEMRSKQWPASHNTMTL
jgi:hypothetical protein